MEEGWDFKMKQICDMNESELYWLTKNIRSEERRREDD